MAIVRNASILFVCTMFGNLSNYCFQFIMGRTLAIEDFGTMNALLSVITSITLPTSAIMMVIAKYASIYTVGGETEGMASLYTRSLEKITILSALVTGVYLVFSGFLKGYLNSSHISPVWILAIGIFGSFLMTVNFGMLQGMQRFHFLGFGIGFGGVLRLLLGVVFIYAGLRLNGALLATVLPTILIFAITLKPLSKFVRRGIDPFRHEKILRYSIPVLISSSAFAFISNVDLIMVKHFLDPREAGLYASAAVLGKTMLYLPSSFALAVFPMVSEADMVNGDPFKILDKSLLCTAGLSLAGLIVFTLGPEQLMGLLFGPRFAEAAGYLKYYGAAMSFMAVLSILISFNLARGNTGFIYSLAIGSVLLVTAINLFHSNMREIMVSITGIFFILTVFNVWLVYRERHAYYRLRYEVLKAEDGVNTDLNG